MRSAERSACLLPGLLLRVTAKRTVKAAKRKIKPNFFMGFPDNVRVLKAVRTVPACRDIRTDYQDTNKYSCLQIYLLSILFLRACSQVKKASGCIRIRRLLRIKSCN
jgi:hypothetical protein